MHSSSIANHAIMRDDQRQEDSREMADGDISGRKEQAHAKGRLCRKRSHGESITSRTNPHAPILAPDSDKLFHLFCTGQQQEEAWAKNRTAYLSKEQAGKATRLGRGMQPEKRAMLTMAMQKAFFKDNKRILNEPMGLGNSGTGMPGEKPQSRLSRERGHEVCCGRCMLNPTASYLRKAPSAIELGRSCSQSLIHS